MQENGWEMEKFEIWINFIWKSCFALSDLIFRRLKMKSINFMQSDVWGLDFWFWSEILTKNSNLNLQVRRRKISKEILDLRISYKFFFCFDFLLGKIKLKIKKLGIIPIRWNRWGEFFEEILNLRIWCTFFLIFDFSDLVKLKSKF